MMRTSPEQLLEYFPCIIQAFIFKLMKKCDLISQFYILGRWEVLINLSTRSFHVVMESDGWEFNHAFTRSFRENEKTQSLNAYCDAPTILKALLTSKKSSRWRWGSSDGSPLKCPIVWSIWNIIGLSSKLTTCTWGVNTT